MKLLNYKQNNNLMSNKVKSLKIWTVTSTFTKFLKVWKFEINVIKCVVAVPAVHVETVTSTFTSSTLWSSCRAEFSLLFASTTVPVHHVTPVLQCCRHQQSKKQHLETQHLTKRLYLGFFSFNLSRLSNSLYWRQLTNLCSHLPRRGRVLARLDAKVPSPLQNVDDRLGRDVEARWPVHLQLARRHFFKG